MKQVPWISLGIAAVAMLNPVGLDFLRSAFFSNEALSRNIARPIVLMAAAILVALIAVEWWLRWRKIS